MKEVYVVYGITPDEIRTNDYRRIYGAPNYLEVFSNKEAAVKFFREKVLETARSAPLERFFSTLADEELLVNTLDLSQAGKYRDRDHTSAFVVYEQGESMSWIIYKSELDVHLDNPLAARVYLKKVVVSDGTESLKELNIIYGVDPKEIACGARGMLGNPTFLMAVADRNTAERFFKEKVIDIARTRDLNERFFSHLTDEKLFVDTPDIKEEGDGPEFIWFYQSDAQWAWWCYEDELSHDILDAMPPRVYLKKRTVWEDEVKRHENDWF